MSVVMSVCERIHVVDHGETIAEGAPAEVRTNPHVLAAYLGEEVTEASPPEATA
jgi:branched-chain amino acid transport system ATP-binding protein